MSTRTNILIHAVNYFREKKLRNEQFAWIISMLNTGVDAHKVGFITTSWAIDNRVSGFWP